MVVYWVGKKIPNQTEVNIKQQHGSETPIAKKKSKPAIIHIPIIKENIETPTLKNTEGNLAILEISNFRKWEPQLSGTKIHIKCEISDLSQNIDSVKRKVYEALKYIDKRVKNTSFKRPFTFSIKRIKF